MWGRNSLMSQTCTYGGGREGIIANNEMRTTKKKSHYVQQSADEE